MSYSFADAVHEAIDSGVPCLRPFSGIRLLQLIYKDDIRRRGCCNCRSLLCCLWQPDSDVLVNIGNNNDTLITLTDKDEIKSKLEGIVIDAHSSDLMIFSAVPLSTFGAALQPFRAALQPDLPTVGLKVTSDAGWELAFGSEQVTKRAVSKVQLSKILQSSDTLWDLPRNLRGVVTAIYVISGGLQYKANTNDVRGPTFAAPTPNTPVSIGAGWQYTVTENQEIIVAEASPVEWIVAIEYLKVSQKEIPGPLINVRTA